MTQAGLGVIAFQGRMLVYVRSPTGWDAHWFGGKEAVPMTQELWRAIQEDWAHQEYKDSGKEERRDG